METTLLKGYRLKRYRHKKVQSQKRYRYKHGPGTEGCRNKKGTESSWWVANKDLGLGLLERRAWVGLTDAASYKTFR